MHNSILRARRFSSIVSEEADAIHNTWTDPKETVRLVPASVGVFRTTLLAHLFDLHPRMPGMLAARPDWGPETQPGDEALLIAWAKHEIAAGLERQFQGWQVRLDAGLQVLVNLVATRGPSPERIPVDLCRRVLEEQLEGTAAADCASRLLLAGPVEHLTDRLYPFVLRGIAWHETLAALWAHPGLTPARIALIAHTSIFESVIDFLCQPTTLLGDPERRLAIAEHLARGPRRVELLARIAQDATTQEELLGYLRTVDSPTTIRAALAMWRACPVSVLRSGPLPRRAADVLHRGTRRDADALAAHGVLAATAGDALTFAAHWAQASSTPDPLVLVEVLERADPAVLVQVQLPSRDVSAILASPDETVRMRALRVLGTLQVTARAREPVVLALPPTTPDPRPTVVAPAATCRQR